MTKAGLLSLCVLVFLALGAARAADTSAKPVKLDVQSDIDSLADRRIIADPAYWIQHVVTGGKCDGARVASLLIRAAELYKPTGDARAAIDVLLEHGVLTSPRYWTEHAVAGATCDAANVAVVLGRIRARLPVAVPASASAKPLEAVDAAQLKGEYDVVVAGAGTGGIGAAVQAARMGRSVLILDETDWVGGQMCAAGVTSMDEGVTLCRERGLYHELCGLIWAYYRPLNINPDTAYWFGHMCVEPRVGRQLLLKLLADARGTGTLDLCLRSRVTKVLKAADTVTGVQVESYSPGGTVTRSVNCKVLIDATEWGDVIPLTGARYRVGNCTNEAIDLTRHVQSNTWCAAFRKYPRGVPPELLITRPPPGYTEKIHSEFARSLVPGTDQKATERPWNFARFIGYRGMPDSSRPGDSPPITRTHLNYNNDFPSTVAEIEDPARRQATDRLMRLKTLCLIYYIQNDLGEKDWAVANDEGYDSPYNRAQIDAWLKERPDLEPYRAILYQFCVMPYTRESRRIIGLHTLTAGEIERKPGHPTLFPDTVALGDYAVDLHGSMTPAYLEPDLDHPEDIPHKFGERGLGPFAIPFGCFIPEKVDGFLPAEKNLSESRMANGATRLQPHTLLMGQAVGAIAALAIERHVQPRQVDPVLVQSVLLDAHDTLFVTPISDVRQSSPN
ncbi:MAG TPA: FAD-dependent oxidoreductase, partial [Tepidisphaeraceae bacterium]|nr:FAD-dependent oxidoreductase [Tepidisphaeraceae bacterium]